MSESDQVAREAKLAILRQRAAALAQPHEPSLPKLVERIQVVEVSLLPDRYGFLLSQVGEVARLKQLTPLPGVPAFVAGITTLRGRVLSVLDLRRYLGITSPGITRLDKFVVLRHAERELAVLVDEVGKVLTLAKDDLQAEVAGMSAPLARVLVGVSRDHLVVVDAERLLGEERLVVGRPGAALPGGRRPPY